MNTTQSSNSEMLVDTSLKDGEHHQHVHQQKSDVLQEPVPKMTKCAKKTKQIEQRHFQPRHKRPGTASIRRGVGGTSKHHASKEHKKVDKYVLPIILTGKAILPETCNLWLLSLLTLS